MSRSTVARSTPTTGFADPAAPGTRPAMTEQDLDAQSPAADLVRVYLNGIGRTALLNAEQEVELAKQIEAEGRYSDIRWETRVVTTVSSPWQVVSGE